jgi:hypothetical protein
LVNPWVEQKFNPHFNLGADDGRKVAADDGMTTSEHLLNAAFVLLVLRQAKEREHRPGFLPGSRVFHDDQ